MISPSGSRPELSIILPTYNERENIALLIPQLVEAFSDVAHEILVVDDSSPDGTGEVVEEIARRFPQVRLLTRREKTGIGSALRAGYAAASGEIILSSDADLSYPVSDLRALYERARGGHDLVIGSRHSANSVYETPSLAIRLKYLASRNGNRLLTRLFRIPVHDFSANCRAIRRPAWERLGTRENTNFFLFEMILAARDQGMRITEVPISFFDRRRGVSKINHVIEIPKAFLKMLAYLVRRGTAGRRAAAAGERDSSPA